MRTAALGVDTPLLDETDNAWGIDVDFEGNALWVSASTARGENLIATRGETTRLRATINANRVFGRVHESARFVPKAHIGVRRDGGDAERGVGVVAGAGFEYRTGRFAFDMSTHGLLSHAEEDARRWGVSASMTLDPGASGTGLGLSIAPGWGAQGDYSGKSLWTANTLDDSVERDAHIALEASYGIRSGRIPGMLVTPYASTELHTHSTQIGTRFALDRVDAEFDLGARSSNEESYIIKATARVRF